MRGGERDGGFYADVARGGDVVEGKQRDGSRYDVAAVQKVRKAAADFGDRSWDLREAARHFGVDVDVIGGMLEVLLTEGFEEFFVGRFGDSVFTIGRIPNESHEEF